MQVIGICRFSYPAIGGFQVEHETIEERIRYLYQPDRLEERFRCFETITLPALSAQTDTDFDLVIVVGDSLPTDHLDRLHDLTSRMPQVSIVARPPMNHRAVMKEILNAARRDPDAPCLQFRQDDDDAVAVDFVERLRLAVAECGALTANHPSVVFDFNRGFIAEPHAGGIRARALVRPLDVAAMAMHAAGGHKNTIMNFAHHKINQFMPVVSYSDTPMFVRTHNRFNDSRQKPVKAVALEPLTDEEEQLFRDRFAIDVAAVRSAFSAP